MAAALNWAGSVTVDGVEHERVRVVVRQNVATLTRGRELVAQRAGVAAVTNAGRLLRDITFDDGSSWRVQKRAGGCGCGK